MASLWSGDGNSTGDRSTRPLRSSGTNAGARDARQAALEIEPSKLASPGSAAREATVANLSEARRDNERELRNNRGLNAVADALHVLGADAAAVAVVEDSSRVRVVADDELSGSAGYDYGRDQILVSQSVVDDAFAAADALQRQGVLDSSGRIVAGREADLDASAYGDRLIKIGTLIGVHEQTHAGQHAEGALDGFAHDASTHCSATLIVSRASGRTNARADPTRRFSGDKFNISPEAWVAETRRIDAEEYDAYLAQERADIALGASLEVQLVTGVDGTPIDRTEGVANIAALERGIAAAERP